MNTSPENYLFLNSGMLLQVITRTKVGIADIKKK